MGPRACGSGCTSGRSRDEPRVCGSWRSCWGAVQRTAVPHSRLLVPPAPSRLARPPLPPCPPLLCRRQAATLGPPPLTRPASPHSASDGLTHAFPLGSSKVLLLTPSPGWAVGAAVCVPACSRTTLCWKQGPPSAVTHASVPPWSPPQTPGFRAGGATTDGHGSDPRQLCQALLEEAWGWRFSQQAVLCAP